MVIALLPSTHDLRTHLNQADYGLAIREAGDGSGSIVYVILRQRSRLFDGVALNNYFARLYPVSESSSRTTIMKRMRAYHLHITSFRELPANKRSELLVVPPSEQQRSGSKSKLEVCASGLA